MRTLLRTLVLLAPAGAASAATWTVEAAGGGDFATLQEAIDAAADGDVVAVGPGTYAEAIDFGGKAIVVASTDGAASTILDGGGATAALVTFAAGEGPEAELRGFTLRNGAETAIRVDGAGPTLAELVIDEAGDYETGAGLAVTGGTPTVTDTTFSGLVATEGSAIALDATSDVVVSGCVFEGGISSYAAIYVDGGTLTMDGSTVEGNWSKYYGALTVLGGGAASLTDTDFSTNRGDYNAGAAIQVYAGATLAVDGGAFSSNWADYGVYYGYTGGAVLVSGGTATIRGATFTGNAGGYGAGVAARSGATVTIADSHFEGNRAYGGLGVAVDSGAALAVVGSTFAGSGAGWSYWGTGIYATGAASLSVEDSVFCANVALDGAGAYVTGVTGAVSFVGNTFHENVASDEGGALYVSGGAPTLADNTFVGNQAATGGAVLLTGASAGFTNNLVAWTAGGDGLVDVTGGSRGSITYNLWYGNAAADVAGALGAADIAGAGNVTGDPVLAGFAADGACGDDLSLGAGSAALDAGDPASTDADGSRSDIGAEGPAPSTGGGDTGDTGDTDTGGPGDTGDTDTGGPGDTDTGGPGDTDTGGPGDTDTGGAGDTDTGGPGDTGDTDTGGPGDTGDTDTGGPGDTDTGGPGDTDTGGPGGGSVGGERPAAAPDGEDGGPPTLFGCASAPRGAGPLAGLLAAGLLVARRRPPGRGGARAGAGTDAVSACRRSPGAGRSTPPDGDAAE